MPVKRCQVDGKPGWSCGNMHCYPYTAGDASSEKRAKQKAIDQCIAAGEDPGGGTIAIDIDHHNKVVRAGRTRADKLEAKLAAAVLRVLDKAADEAASGFRRSATDHVLAAGDPPGWTPPLANEVIDVDELIARFRGKTDPVRRALIEAVMGAALEGHGLAFDVTNPLTAKVLAQSGSQIVDIASTTQLNVMRIIREAYEAGLTIPDTAKAIKVGMREANTARAVLIARTEMVGAVNGGSLAASQIVSDASVTAGEGGMLKVWLTAEGAVWPRHEEYDDLDGQTQELDAPFDVGGEELMFPGDPDGPPEEVCNCRCALAYEDAGASGAGVPAEISVEV